MIQRSPQYLQDGLPSPEMLASVLREHANDCARLVHLGEAYSGMSAIVSRTRGPGLPNNRIAHPFARYIVAVTTGYLIGKPAGYKVASDGESPALDAVLDAYRRGSVASVDAENARNAAIYGRGVDYTHADEDGDAHSVALSPIDAFVVYEDSYSS